MVGCTDLWYEWEYIWVDIFCDENMEIAILNQVTIMKVINIA